MSTQLGLLIVWFTLSASVLVGAIFAISISFSLTRTGVIITSLLLGACAIGLTCLGEMLVEKI
jgi:hypothetical protein